MVTRQKVAIVRPKQEQDTPAPATAIEWLTDEMYDGDTLTTALDALCQDLGIEGDAQAEVHISKLDGLTKGEEANVKRCSPEEYDLHATAMEYGSGKYRIRVYVRVQTGQRVLKGNKVISWLLSPTEERERTARLEGEKTSNYVTKDDLETILSRVIAQVKVNAPPPVDQMALIKTVLEMSAAFRQPEPAQPAVNPLDYLKIGIELAGKAATNEKPEISEVGSNQNDVFITMMEQFGPTFAAVMQERMKNPAQAAPALLPAPATAPAQEKTEIDQQSVEEAGMEQMKMGLAFLVMQAQAGNPVETYAELIIDNVPEDTLQVLITSPDPVTELAKVDPNIDQFREWFTELIDSVKKILSDINSESIKEK